MTGFEAALWRALIAEWLDGDTVVSAPVLDWLVHNKPAAHSGVDIAWCDNRLPWW